MWWFPIIEHMEGTVLSHLDEQMFFHLFNVFLTLWNTNGQQPACSLSVFFPLLLDLLWQFRCKGASVLPRHSFLSMSSLRSIKMPHLCENSSGMAFEVLGLGCPCQSAFLTATSSAEIVNQYPWLNPVGYCRERCGNLQCQTRNCVLSRCSAGAVWGSEADGLNSKAFSLSLPTCS